MSVLGVRNESSVGQDEPGNMARSGPALHSQPNCGDETLIMMPPLWNPRTSRSKMVLCLARLARFLCRLARFPP